MLKYLREMAKTKGLKVGDNEITYPEYTGTLEIPDIFQTGYVWGSGGDVTIKFPDIETEIAFLRWAIWGVEPGTIEVRYERLEEPEGEA